MAEVTELEKDLFNAKELLESYKRQGMQEPLLNEVRQHIQSLSEKLEHQRIADRDNSSDRFEDLSLPEIQSIDIGKCIIYRRQDDSQYKYFETREHAEDMTVKGLSEEDQRRKILLTHKVCSEKMEVTEWNKDTAKLLRYAEFQNEFKISPFDTTLRQVTLGTGAADTILERSGENKKNAGVYHTHGSTFCLASIDIEKTNGVVVSQIKQQLHSLEFSKLQNEEKIKFFVYGAFYTWSPLPVYDMVVEFEGVYKKVGKHAIMLGKTSTAFQNDNRLEADLLKLMEKEEVACIFKLKYFTNMQRKFTKVFTRKQDGKNVPKEETHSRWEGKPKKMTKGTRELKYTGNYLRGFLPSRSNITQKAKSDFCAYLASLYESKPGEAVLSRYTGVPSFGAKLKLRPEERKQLKYRLNDAVNFERRSETWLKTAAFFQPTYGQYLIDKWERLNAINEFLESAEYVDTFFYGNFDYCFKYPPYQQQVEATLQVWQERFPEQMSGWEERFEIWEKLVANKKMKNSTVFKTDMEETKLEFFIQHDIIKVLSRSPLKICFTADYRLMTRFVKTLMESKTPIYVGNYDVQEKLLLLPRHGIIQYHIDMFEEIPQFQVVDNRLRYDQDCERSNPQERKTIRDLVRKANGRTIVLYGADLWPFDTLVYFMHALRHENIHMHVFGLKSLVRCGAGLRDRAASFEYYDSSFTIQKNPLDHHAMEKDYDEQESYEEYTFVCYSKKERAKLLPKIKKSGTNFNKYCFAVGDKVAVKKTGEVARILSIQNGNSVSCEDWKTSRAIKLDGIKNQSKGTDFFVANELKQLRVVLLHEMTRPMKNLVMYGQFPRYVLDDKEQLAVENLVMFDVCCLDDVLTKQKKMEITIPCEQETSFLYCIEEQRRKEEEKKKIADDAATQAYKEDKKRKLMELAQLHRKRLKEKEVL